MTFEAENYDTFEKEIKSMVDTVLDDKDHFTTELALNGYLEESTICDENSNFNNVLKGRRSSTCKEIFKQEMIPLGNGNSPRSNRKNQTIESKLISPSNFIKHSLNQDKVENNFQPFK